MGSLRSDSARWMGACAVIGVVLILEALLRARGTVTLALEATSVVMFTACVWASLRLLGERATTWFVLIALPVGWFAEQMGSSRGWFFGRYSYTDVLGWQLGNVPVVIPMMWFALVFTGYVMACLMLWRSPVLSRVTWMTGLITAWTTAMVVTAFDLGADPYFVFVLKAWIMEKKDGGWFGETLQGFVGWMAIAAVIVTLWLSLVRRLAEPVHDRLNEWAVAVPLLIYGGEMVFQMIYGHPIEIRAIAFFAMGIPLLVTMVAWMQWANAGKQAGVAS